MATAPRQWLFFDYNQAESRLVAERGPVPKLKKWYDEGVDVHAHVCQLIARVVQENKIKTPINVATGIPYFHSKPWQDYRKGDDERDISKRVVHAYNYGLGPDKLALIVGISLEFASILLKVYSTLFPEIKINYHGWVEACLKKNRTIWMPEPVRFRKVFWDDVSKPEVQRSAYSCYPQCTIGSMLKRTISILTRVFREDEDAQHRNYWEAWYGKENWDEWRLLRAMGDRSPKAILWSGFDCRLNVHDACGLSVPDDPELLRWVATSCKDVAETSIIIEKGHSVVIPVDFAVGPSWGDLKKYEVLNARQEVAQ